MVTITNMAHQEQKLDEAQNTLREVLKHIRNDLTGYHRADVRKLENAIIALDEVTFRRDI
jgi:5-bromo-4-chloroindolyl phosphate hydrolysis protein